MKKINILDCTLRDGGYYNDWDFSHGLASKLFPALNSSGVDIVEVGYKAPPQPGFSGLYRYCPETQLQFLRPLDRVAYAFMIDAKEFLSHDGSVDRAFVDRYIPAREQSIFSWCRVATHNSTVRGATDLIRILKDRGYRTCYNAMGISLLSEKQIVTQLAEVASAKADVFYFADSFGSLRPEDVLRYLRLIRSEYAGAIGIHTHDNQGMAFANTEAAVTEGVDYIDGTVMGMGRGAGNLKTEQMLLSLYFHHRRADLDPYALLEVIEDEFMPLHARYKWGWDFTYMVSGMQNIHPTYCQKLKSTHQFTMGQVANILGAIPEARRTSFNTAALTEATNEVLPLRGSSDGGARVPIPKWNVPPAKSVLIVATGPSVREHSSALQRFIAEHKPLVIECNHTGILAGTNRIMAILNEVRLKELSGSGVLASDIDIVTGLESIPPDLALPNLRHVPCSIAAQTVQADKERVTIPAFVVGMFAPVLAAQTGAERIWLAGFDGFTDAAHASEQQEMHTFWRCFRQQIGPKTEVVSLLPTSYDLPSRSIYSLIN
jgi:4-hydroxy 2-oxovalerate aldolase